MIKLTRITDVASGEYRFTEELLTSTFPHEEYRPLPEQRSNTTGKREFHLMLAQREDEPVGFISYWEIEDLCYVEHLAIVATMRGHGLGREILTLLKKSASKIVLEVEEPVDELTTRRIDFYSRAGFELCLQEYRQPPYRKGDGTLPMRLMFHGCIANNENFSRAKRLIYDKIYNYKEE